MAFYYLNIWLYIYLYFCTDGLIVANDVNNARCYMLVHQAKRLNSANVMITNHDATVLPIMNLDENGLLFLLIVYW